MLRLNQNHLLLWYDDIAEFLELTLHVILGLLDENRHPCICLRFDGSLHCWLSNTLVSDSWVGKSSFLAQTLGKADKHPCAFSLIRDSVLLIRHPCAWFVDAVVDYSFPKPSNWRSNTHVCRPWGIPRLTVRHPCAHQSLVIGTNTLCVREPVEIGSSVYPIHGMYTLCAHWPYGKVGILLFWLTPCVSTVVGACNGHPMCPRTVAKNSWFPPTSVGWTLACVPESLTPGRQYLEQMTLS